MDDNELKNERVVGLLRKQERVKGRDAETVSGCLLVGVFVLDCLLMLWAFLMARFTTSYASRDWVPESTEKERAEAVEKANQREEKPPSKEERAFEMFETVKWCVHCRAFKPPRAHHCSKCGCCTLRLDHHCPMTGSCIGYWNQRYFFQFITYNVIMIYISIPCLLIKIYNFLSDPETLLDLYYFGVISFFFAVLFFFFQDSLLCIRQWKNVFRNETTLEVTENTRVRKSIPRYHNMYDLGKSQNIRSFLGPSLLWWVLPIPLPSNSYKDNAGYIYPVRKD